MRNLFGPLSMTLLLSLSPSLSLFVTTRRASSSVQFRRCGGLFRWYLLVSNRVSFILALPSSRENRLLQQKKKEKVLAVDCPCNFISCLRIHRPLLDYSRSSWREGGETMLKFSNEPYNTVEFTTSRDPERSRLCLRFTICDYAPQSPTTGSVITVVKCANTREESLSRSVSRRLIISSVAASPSSSAFIARKAHRF